MSASNTNPPALPPAPPHPDSHQRPAAQFWNLYVMSLKTAPDAQGNAQSLTDTEAAAEADRRWDVEHAQIVKDHDDWLALKSNLEEQAEQARLDAEKAEAEKQAREKEQAEKDAAAAEAKEREALARSVRLESEKRALEKAKKVMVMPTGVPIPDENTSHPCQYAMKKLQNRSRVPVEYFAYSFIQEQNTRRAAGVTDDLEGPALTMSDGQRISLLTGRDAGTDVSGKTSRAREDAQLDFNTLSEGLTGLAEAMERCGYDISIVQAWHVFAPTLEKVLPKLDCDKSLARRTAVAYAAGALELFWNWVEAVWAGDDNADSLVFDAATINMKRLRTARDNIRGRDNDAAMSVPFPLFFFFSCVAFANVLLSSLFRALFIITCHSTATPPPRPLPP
jgi:hypothetical protein